MASILTVEEVRRDKDKRVVWVKIKVVVEKIGEYKAIFQQRGNKVKRIWYPGKDRSIPEDIYRHMLRKAYAIIFDERIKPPKQLDLPLNK